MNTDNAPETTPVSQGSTFSRLAAWIRGFSQPPEQPAPLGLGVFVLLVALLAVYFSVQAGLSKDASMEKAYAQGATRLMTTFLTLQATIFAFDPRKRKLAYGLLTVIIVFQSIHP